MKSIPASPIRWFCRALLGATFGLTSLLSLHAQNPAVFVKFSTSQAANGAAPTVATTTTIAAPGTGWVYSGAAPHTGETWNVIQRPGGNDLIKSGTGNTLGTFVLNTANGIGLSDPNGVATGVTLTGSIVVGELNGTRTEPNTGTGSSDALYGPSALMNQAWRIYLGKNETSFKVAGLPAGANYYLYVYGSTINSGAKFVLNAANVPTGSTATEISTSGSGTGNVFALDAGSIAPVAAATPNVASASGQNTTWGRLHAVVDGTGAITFGTVKNAQNGQYFNGFQLIPYPVATFVVQPPPSPSGSLGGSVSITASVTGEGTLTYQWRKDGVPIDTAANPSASTSTLTLNNLQNSDAGSYDLLVTNPGGTATSAAAVLTLTAGAVAPSISTQPAHQTAQVNGTVTFSVLANGTAPLTYLWEKSNDGVSFSAVGGNSAQLAIASVQTADAARYRVTVTNSAGTATSEIANLIVAPVITMQPTGSVVAPGAAAAVTAGVDAGAGAPEATVYVWKRDGVTVVDGSGISGASTANLQFAGFLAAQSGYYTLTASNSAGSVTSGSVYVGVPSTQSVTFAPGNNATGIAVDQQLRLIFPSAPRLGNSGTLKVYDSADDSVVATIDVAQFVTYTPGNASATIPNAAIRSVQGASYYYMPIAIYGNEVWITLSPTQRLSYGKTYYVTMDTGVLLDSTNAAYPGVSGATAWRFSTKAAGPETPTASTGPTTITVAQDGDGDFATFQGAFDWIPQNNTLPRTIQVKPGVYRDNATLAQNRNFVTIVGTGASRTDAQLVYPFAYFAPPNSIFTAGSLRIESSDVTVRNLTLDNIIYQEYRPTGLTTSGSAAFAGAINTLATTGNRIVCDNLLIKGGQDTIYNVQGIIYYYDCEVWGSVDFIYGKALAVFDHCDIVQIRSTGGPITAPNTVYGQPYGLVFLNCAFPRASIADGYPYDVGDATTTFQRPWGNDGSTAIVNCELGTHITTKGWSEWDGRENTGHALEYGSTLIGGGVAPTPAERQAAGAYWLNTIDPDYTSGSMSPTDPLLVSPGGIANRQPVTVNPADYTLSAIFGHAYFALNGWTPAVPPRITTQPLGRSIEASQSATFTVVGSGEPAPTYQWYKNGNAIAGATESTYTIASATGEDAGDYTVVLTNSAGNVTSEAATLAVNTTVIPTAITTQPASQSVTEGQAVTLAVAADGSALTYQWKKDGADISGATNASLLLNGVSAADSGSYTVVVTGTGGVMTSNAATLTVSARTVKTVFADTFASGSTVNSATPADPTATSTAYQILSDKGYNPTPSVGATGLKFGVGNTSSGNVEAQALFSPAPVILSGVGDYLELTATLTNVRGMFSAGNNTLFVGLYDSNQVAPVAGGLNGFMNGGTFTHAIGYAQKWTGYVSRTIYSGGSHQITTRVPQTGNNNQNQSLASVAYRNPVGAVVGTAQPSTLATFPEGAQYTSVLRITRSAAEEYTIESRLHEGVGTEGAVLVTYSGVAAAATFLTDNADHLGFDGLAVGARVSGTGQTIEINSINITTNASLIPVPKIVNQPEGQTVGIGGAASFAITAEGTGLTYQWFKNDVVIDGATEGSYSVTDATAADQGVYKVVVTNDLGGRSTSARVELIVDIAAGTPPPDGFGREVTGGGNRAAVTVTTAADLKAQAETSIDPAVITISGTLDLSSVGGSIAVKSNKTIQGIDQNATVRGTLYLGSGGVNNVLIRGLNITNPGSVINEEGKYADGGDGVSIRDATNVFITHCSVYDCADGLIDIGFGSDNVTVSWCEFYYTPAALVHRFTMISGNAGAETKPIHITLHHNLWHDRCDQRMPSGSYGYVHLYNNYWNTPGNSYASNARDQSQFLSEYNAYHQVKSPLYKQNVDTTLPGGLIRAIGNLYTEVTGIEPDAGGDAVFTPDYSYQMLTAADVPTVVLTGAGNTAGAASASLEAGSATLNGPTGVVPVNTSFTLTANVTGFTPVAYQWRKDNFDVAGATGATFTVSAMKIEDEGDYTLTMTAADGDTLVSAPHAIVYSSALVPVITSQPVSQTVTAGAAANFTVVAEGDAPLAYQWQKLLNGNFVNVTGATSTSFGFANAQSVHAGDYRVVVSNEVGTATSATVTLTVDAAAGGGTSGGGSETGGGGGGAPSLWFFGALGVLAALRRRFRRE